jgi:hypothetical protein
MGVLRWAISTEEVVVVEVVVFKVEKRRANLRARKDISRVRLVVVMMLRDLLA